MKTLITECLCSDPSHIMAFYYDLSDEHEAFSELYIQVQLNQILPWWKRITVAMSFVLGKRSRFSYGHWDEGSIGIDGAKKLMAALSDYITRWGRETASEQT